MFVKLGASGSYGSEGHRSRVGLIIEGVPPKLRAREGALICHQSANNKNFKLTLRTPPPILPSMGTFYHKNAEGLLELIDEVTGKVVAVQLSPTATSDLRVIEGPDGVRVAVPRSLPDERLAPLLTKSYAFNQCIADLICQEVIEGKTLSQVCQMQGFPSYTILRRWMRNNKDFATAVEEAQRARAMAFHDGIVQSAEDYDRLSTSEEIAAKKAKVEALKWLSQVGNADSYGNKTKVSGDAAAPLQIIVDTGIRRDSIDVTGVVPVQPSDATSLGHPEAAISLPATDAVADIITDSIDYEKVGF